MWKASDLHPIVVARPDPAIAVVIVGPYSSQRRAIPGSSPGMTARGGHVAGGAWLLLRHMLLDGAGRAYTMSLIVIGSERRRLPVA